MFAINQSINELINQSIQRRRRLNFETESALEKVGLA